MADQTIDYKLVLDIHPKLRTIPQHLRSKAAKEFRTMFSGMYPKVRLLYHRSATSQMRPEHVFVVFDRACTPRHFWQSFMVQNPPRAVCGYNADPIQYLPHILEEIQEILDVADEGEVTLHGLLFGETEEESAHEDSIDVDELEEFQAPLFDYAQSNAPNENEDGVDSIYDQLERLDPEFHELFYKITCHMSKKSKILEASN